MNTYKNSGKREDKNLPWWVELLFVQIGLPDNLLIKILKAKKKSKELIKTKKIVSYIFIYIYFICLLLSVIKHAKNKLDCEAIAKIILLKIKKISINKRVKMLSTNFCYGGEEIYKIENLNY